MSTMEPQNVAKSQKWRYDPEKIINSYDYLGLWRVSGQMGHKAITRDAWNQGAPEDIRNVRRILNIILDGNGDTDEGSDGRTRALHYSRDLDQDPGEARDAYSAALQNNVASFNQILSPETLTKKQCKQALKIFGQLTHQWEDYYGHAIIVGAEHRGNPGQIQGTPDSPSPMFEPISWGSLIDWGGHGYKEPAWREEDGGADRRQQSVDFVVGKIQTMMPTWAAKCRCHYVKEK